MAENDLTSKIAQYLDRHMIFPLLEFLSSHRIYDEREIVEMKVDLLKNTNMVDFAMECYRNLHPDEQVPEELVDKRGKIVEELVELTDQVSPFIDLFDKEDVKKLIETDRYDNDENLIIYLDTSSFLKRTFSDFRTFKNTL